MKYPGGKGLIFQRLINLIPPHEVYIETHLGGGAIIRNKLPAQENIGIEIDPKVIAKWKTIKNNHNFKLINDDAIKFLKSYNFTGRELVYCDPPYLRETRKKNAGLYRFEYSLRQHIELLKVIKRLPCMVLISGYESSLYKESLRDWYTYCFKDRKSTRLNSSHIPLSRMPSSA